MKSYEVIKPLMIEDIELVVGDVWQCDISYDNKKLPVLFYRKQESGTQQFLAEMNMLQNFRELKDIVIHENDFNDMFTYILEHLQSTGQEKDRIWDELYTLSRARRRISDEASTIDYKYTDLYEKILDFYESIKGE